MDIRKTEEFDITSKLVIYRSIIWNSAFTSKSQRNILELNLNCLKWAVFVYC